MEVPTLEEVARRHGVRLVLQFGSTVTGPVHPRSDMDLAVRLDRPSLSLRQRAELLHDLQTIFPDREVDPVVLNHADPLLLKRVVDGCRLVYGTDRELHELRIYAFKRYQDHRKYLDLERQFVSRALGAGSAT